MEADEPPAPPGPGGSKFRRLALEAVVLVVVASVVALGIKGFVAQAFSIPSASMTPQLEVGDRVLVSRTAYHLHEPRRGDIVVFHDPSAPDDSSPLPLRAGREVLEGVGILRPGDTELIKRIVGLEGESVSARGGRVFIDGRELVEPYLPDGVFTADFGPVLVPDGHVFVMGDNRTNSVDSRIIGTIDEDTIVGRAILRIWPPGRWAWL